MIFRQSLRKKFIAIFVLMFFVSSLFGVKVLAADTATCATGFTCKCNGTPYPAVNSVVNASGATNVTASATCNSECLKQFPKTTEWDLSCGASHVNQGSTAAPVAASEPTKTYEPPHLSVPIPGLTLLPNQAQDGYIVTNYLGQYVQAIYRLLIAIVSIGAVLQIMIAGMQWMMARGNASAVSKARDSIVSSLTSIVILLSVAAIAQFIDPGLTTIAGLKVKLIDPIPLTEDTASDIGPLSLPDPAGGTNGVPYFTQRNYNEEYGKCSAPTGGNTTIKTSGCGPTSFAMVLSKFGVKTDPPRVASTLVEEGYRICNKGTDAQGFVRSSLITDNGLNAHALIQVDPATIESELDNGNLVIISVGPSRFTKHGHFMVITGKKSNGDFSINDPNSGYDTITRQEVSTIVKYSVAIGKK